MGEIIKYAAYIVLIISLGALSYNTLLSNMETTKNIDNLVEINKDNKQVNLIYYDQTIKSLKTSNKELYDSLKYYKEKVDYYIHFKYEKKYHVEEKSKDTIVNVNDKNDSLKVYEYSSAKNDTLDYKLKIGSTRKPLWYSIDFKVKNGFTVLNTKENDMNHTTITPDVNGDIINTEIFKNKEKKKFKDRIKFCPSVGTGYGFIHNKFDIYIGGSLVIDISK